MKSGNRLKQYDHVTAVEWELDSLSLTATAIISIPGDAVAMAAQSDRNYDCVMAILQIFRRQKTSFPPQISDF